MYMYMYTVIMLHAFQRLPYRKKFVGEKFLYVQLHLDTFMLQKHFAEFFFANSKVNTITNIKYKVQQKYRLQLQSY